MNQRQFHPLDALLHRQARRRTQRSATLLTDGKLHVVLCGTGCPMPDPTRVGACVAVIASHTFVLFDSGPGAARRVDLEYLPLGQLQALFLTHVHKDVMNFMIN